MVRQAVRQAHGPERSRRTHHPELHRRAISKFKAPITQTNLDLGRLLEPNSAYKRRPNRLASWYSETVSNLSFAIWDLFVICHLEFGIYPILFSNRNYT